MTEAGQGLAPSVAAAVAMLHYDSTMTESAHRNRLSGETSPYLLQHADNPVNWLPWGTEALELAREQNKPILLSIGYSACHWCHVMAHESFEDEETATLMNELFVNVKVDREERPDLDKIYQTAHQMLTQRTGGWPLTMFLSPRDHVPFFGGTYFPKKSQHGMPAFTDVLGKVAEYYRDHHDDVVKQNASLCEVFGRLNPPPAGEVTIDDGPLEAIGTALAHNFDAKWGGFGRAPKFPHPVNLEWLLRWWAVSADESESDALSMAALTMHRMALGGINDQLGGGFCRYSVDDYWMIPHFEKMLYDNGPLLGLYSQLARASGEELYRRTADETADWVMRDMQSSDGGYFSTLDADSEGAEGKFYVWDTQEVQKLLTEEEYKVFAPHFGLDRSANFEGDWHLHVFRPLEEIAEEHQISEHDARRILDAARQKLLATRNDRIWPGRDEKILTAWNGLMIKGMAQAARYLERPELAESAERAVDFIKAEMWKHERLLATYKDGRARLSAYLDDHVFLVDGLLELLQVRWRTEDLVWATELAEIVLQRFIDREHGGFYFVADDHEKLMHRPKTLGDDATPSGNGIAALALGRLGHLLGDTRYLAAVENTLLAAWEPLQSYPHAHASLVIALDEYRNPPEIVVLRGSQDELGHWHRQASGSYSPRRLVFAIPDDAPDLPGALALRKPKDGTVAYVCRGNQCSAPLETLEALAAELG